VTYDHNQRLTVRVNAFRYAGGAAIALPEFDMKAGEIVVVSGRSGSGKSTLLHLVTGVLALEKASGHISVCGVELAGLSQSTRDRLRPHQVGWMPQRVHLVSALNVIDNVLLPFTMSASAAASIDALGLRAHELLGDVGVAQYENAMPSTLSVGQASRVCAVRSLVAMPKLLCADEPSAALDGESAVAIAQVIARYAREGGAALIATHDRAFIESLRKNTESVREIALIAQ
jgi:putative ABC transport system ATP-binding protein